MRLSKKIMQATNINPSRIAVLNTHPIQYFSPLYFYLNQSEEFEITALYCTDYSLRGAIDSGFGSKVVWDIDLLKGYKVVFLGKRSKVRTPGGFWSLVCPEVWGECRSGKYDVLILHGHNFAVNILALIAARSAGVKVFIRGETHLGLTRNFIRKWLRKPLLNLLYRQCDRCLAIGTLNHQFYSSMGVPDDKIFMVPYSIDNDRFLNDSRITEKQRAEILKNFGVSTDKPVVLYASKFQKRKRPLDVLKAIGNLNNAGVECSVLLVGSGEMEDELKQYVTNHTISNVHFTGFINQKDLPKVYGASDIFVMPSEDEPWGLVVNEVMCAALPVVISEEIGCVPDLIKNGENGIIFPAGDIVGIEKALKKLINNKTLRKEMGQRSVERIKNWGFKQCHEGLINALR